MAGEAEETGQRRLTRQCNPAGGLIQGAVSMTSGAGVCRAEVDFFSKVSVGHNFITTEI